MSYTGFPGGAVVKNVPASAGAVRDMDLILGGGRSPGVGNGNPLQYSCLKNFVDRGAWLATVHGVIKCQRQLNTHTHTHTHTHRSPSSTGVVSSVISHFVGIRTTNLYGMLMKSL